MKSIVLKISIILLLIGVSLGCQSSSKNDGNSVTKGVPGFYLNPPQSDDAFYGVGSAKQSSLDRSRTMAISRAREDIAFQMNANIKSAITDYFQEAGTGDNTQVLSFVESISLQVTEVTLTGVKTDTVEVAEDGTVYVLAVASKDNFKKAASDSFKRNEEAAFSEFKAEEALKFLEKSLSK